MLCRYRTLVVILIAFHHLGSGALFGQTVDLGDKLDGGIVPFVSTSIVSDGKVLGPQEVFPKYMLLDTGAPGVYVYGALADQLEAADAEFRVDVVSALGLNDVRVDFFISEPLTVSVDDVVTIDHVAIMSDPIERFFGIPPISGIVGMPAMVERVTSFDYSPEAAEGSLLERLYKFVDVEFSNQVPESMGHRYGIPATPFTFSTSEFETPPTIGPIPLIELSHRVGCETSTGTYLFDTGAQISFMAMDRLREMGLSPDDAIGATQITSADGTFEQLLFRLDELRMPTENGTDLVWRRSDGMPFSVNGVELRDDIPFDGVLGADFFASNAVEQIHLDFREFGGASDTGSGTIYFDIAPALDKPATVGEILAADANADGLVDGRDRAIWEAHNGQTETRCSTGDFNRDGRTDDADLVVWQQQRSTNCDLNADGVCEVSDLDLLLTAVGTVRTEFDLDASGGLIDLADRDRWLISAGEKNTGLHYLLGDLNFDGAVDSQDLNAVGRNWNMAGSPSYADGDIDGDQFVGPKDLNGIGLNWQRSNAPLAVPEPCCAWWLCVSLTWGWRVRDR